MKRIIIFILPIIFLTSCKPNQYTNVEIKRDNKSFNLLIYKNEDSTEVIIPFSFILVNNSNEVLELNPIKPKRKVTFLTEQHTINKMNELESFFFFFKKNKYCFYVLGNKK